MRYIAFLSLGLRSSGSLTDYTTLRLGEILSRDLAICCLAVAVDDFSLTGDTVLIRRGLKIAGKQIVAQAFDKPIKPNYVFFVHHTAAGHYAACLALLTRISQQGIATNYDADAAKLGVKSVLEMRCLEYEASSGRAITRPQTLIVKGAQDKGRIVDFMSTVGPCIAKPHNSSRSRGVQVLTDETQIDALPLDKTCHVVQELVSEPLLIDGYKTGLRVYLIISDLKQSYVLAEQGLVKLADQRYIRGCPEAEIVGPYIQHNGQWPVIHLLADLVRVPATRAAWLPIRQSVETTLDRLMEAVSWRAGMYHQRVPSLQLWGVDMLIQKSGSAYLAYLIEVNTLAQLYRQDVRTDQALDRMLCEEFFTKVS